MARWKIKNKKKETIAKKEPPKWDKGSIIGLLLFVCVMGLFIFLLLVDVKGYFIKRDSNWTTTSGSIYFIEDIYGMNQSREGNKTYISGYKIRYGYMVNDSLYVKDVMTNARGFVRHIRSNEKEWNIEVYYKKNNPDKVYVNTDLNSDFYD